MSQTKRVYINKNYVIFCGSVTLIILCIVGGAWFMMESIYREGKEQLSREADMAVDAFSEHTAQIVSQVDALLNAVRMFYFQTSSIPEAQVFIDELGFNKSVIDNLYLIDRNGEILNTGKSPETSVNVSDRDYFQFHKANPSDSLFISPVETGKLTGLNHFRISKRMDNPDGSFKGVTLASVNPKSFARYFEEIRIGHRNIASLLGPLDKKFRVRIPEPEPDVWGKPVDTILWKLLETSDSGKFTNLSPLDKVLRFYTYRKLSHLPLVMVVGFSDADIMSQISERRHYLIVAHIMTVVFILALSAALVIVVVNRDRLAAAKSELEKNNMALAGEVGERKRIEKEKSELIQELQDALDQVKKLSGFLPICSSCKKIRDDQGYWHQVEKYVRDHSEAEFSHSICPDCMKTLYPEYADAVLSSLDIDKKK